MKKKTIDLVVKGEVDVNGVIIKHIEGGFGENQKCLTCKDIAEIHNVRMNDIQDLILNNLDEFETGIDILDLMDENFKTDAVGLGLITSNRQKHCFLLSEQGYFALACLMRTDKAKEIRKKIRREYFHMKEELKRERKYKRNNNRFTSGSLLKIGEMFKNETELDLLTNNAVRNEVERVIEEIGVKAGVIAVNADFAENNFSAWRTRKVNFSKEELERIVNIIYKFKDFVK